MPIFRKDGRNILFIHVPKAGGTSIEMVFKQSGYQRAYLDGKMGPQSVNYVRRCTPQHMHAAMLETNFRLDRFDAMFLVVREPMARLRSEYLWRLRDRDPRTDASAVEKWAKSAFRRYAADPFVFDNHLRPQVEFKLAGARTYHLEQGLGSILADLDKRWSLGLDTEIPRARHGEVVAGRSSRDVEISPALERLVKDFYVRDYAEFDYPR